MNTSRSATTNTDGARRDYHAEAAKETDDSLAKVIGRLEAAIQSGGANTALVNGQLNAYRKEQKRRQGAKA